jgi:hypothetical protein
MGYWVRTKTDFFNTWTRVKDFTFLKDCELEVINGEVKSEKFTKGQVITANVFHASLENNNFIIQRVLDNGKIYSVPSNFLNEVLISE